MVLAVVSVVGRIVVFVVVGVTVVCSVVGSGVVFCVVIIVVSIVVLAVVAGEDVEIVVFCITIFWESECCCQCCKRKMCFE